MQMTATIQGAPAFPAFVPGTPCRRCGCRPPSRARYCPDCGLRLTAARTRRGSHWEAFVLGILLREMGGSWCPAAIRSFRTAMERSPGSIEPILEIARTYKQMGRAARARRWYRRAAQRGPCRQAWIEGARTFPQCDAFNRARWLGRAVALGPDDRVLADEFWAAFGRLTGWHRWWIERSFCRKPGRWLRIEANNVDITI